MIEAHQLRVYVMTYPVRLRTVMTTLGHVSGVHKRNERTGLSALRDEQQVGIMMRLWHLFKTSLLSGYMAFID